MFSITKQSSAAIGTAVGAARSLLARSKLLFVASAGGACVLSSVLGDVLLSSIGVEQVERYALKSMSPPQLVITAALLSPLVETFLLQLVPVALASRLGKGETAQFFAGWVPFAALHFTTGFRTGVTAGVAVGAILSLSYVAQRPYSVHQAFWVTALVHAVHNSSLVAAYLLGFPAWLT